MQPTTGHLRGPGSYLGHGDDHQLGYVRLSGPGIGSGCLGAVGAPLDRAPSAQHAPTLTESPVIDGISGVSGGTRHQSS